MPSFLCLNILGYPRQGWFTSGYRLTSYLPTTSYSDFHSCARQPSVAARAGSQKMHKNTFMSSGNERGGSLVTSWKCNITFIVWFSLVKLREMKLC